MSTISLTTLINNLNEMVGTYSHYQGSVTLTLIIPPVLDEPEPTMLPSNGTAEPPLPLPPNILIFGPPQSCGNLLHNNSQEHSGILEL